MFSFESFTNLFPFRTFWHHLWDNKYNQTNGVVDYGPATIPKWHTLIHIWCMSMHFSHLALHESLNRYVLDWRNAWILVFDPSHLIDLVFHSPSWCDWHMEMDFWHEQSLAHQYSADSIVCHRVILVDNANIDDFPPCWPLCSAVFHGYGRLTSDLQTNWMTKTWNDKICIDTNMNHWFRSKFYHRISEIHHRISRVAPFFQNNYTRKYAKTFWLEFNLTDASPPTVTCTVECQCNRNGNFTMLLNLVCRYTNDIARVLNTVLRCN